MAENQKVAIFIDPKCNFAFLGPQPHIWDKMRKIALKIEIHASLGTSFAHFCSDFRNKTPTKLHKMIQKPYELALFGNLNQALPCMQRRKSNVRLDRENACQNDVAVH